MSILAFGHWICSTIWHVMLLVYQGSQKKRLPPIKNDLLLKPATELAALIRKRKVSSQEVVKAYIDRVKAVNPLINALVENRFVDALSDARAADEYITTSGKTPDQLAQEKPFLGVPFTSKNAIGVKGMTMDAGVFIIKGKRAEVDSEAAARMRNAGAIPLCITNVPELCMWADASCTLYGITKNPYDLTKTPGGSSGGESALIGAAGSIFGLGNDIFGSVRNPAYNCCIFAHKPTRLIIPNAGQFPSSYKNDLDNYNVTGPMCRYAVDLLPMYRTLAGSNASKLQLDQRVNLGDLKFYYTEDYSTGPYVSAMQKEVKEQVCKVKEFLEKTHGVRVEKISLPVATARFFHIWMSKYGAAKATSMEEMLAPDPSRFSIVKEIIKWCFRLSRHTIHVLSFMVVRSFSSASDPEVSKKNHDDFNKLESFLEKTLGNNGLFLFPPAPESPYYHNEQIFKIYNNGYTGIFSLMGFPVTECSMGLNAKGIPLGVQVVGNRHNDHLTLAMAVELEKQFGGWQAP